MYLYIPASASEPCFTGFRGVLRDANMLVPVCQMHSNHLQIRTLTGVITEIPALRMKNFLTDQMQPPWKRQSANLWMAAQERGGFKDLDGLLGRLPVPTVKASQAITHNDVVL